MADKTDNSRTPEDQVIVLFGPIGDLAKRSFLPSLYHLDRTGLMPDRWRIVGTGRSELTDDEFRVAAHGAIKEFGPDGNGGKSLSDFVDRLTYVAADVTQSADELAAGIGQAEREIGGEPRRFYYFSTPPSTYAPITRSLAGAGLTQRARLVYEKPYGLDLGGFEELDGAVREVLDEDQVFRLDHFLGKESLQNLTALRSANTMFEAAWNREHIDHVQIDVPETFDVGERAGFYEQTGALRDVVSTHLFQALSVVAMAPPADDSPGSLARERAKVFKAMRRLSAEDVVYGQFTGYTDTTGVGADSRTETFAAVRAFVDNDRWEGVPFFLRTGKRMAEDHQRLTVVFKEPRTGLSGDRLTINLYEEQGLYYDFFAKRAGPGDELEPARTSYSFGPAGALLGDHERLIHDALIGDDTLFTTPEGLRNIFEAIEPVLENPPEVHPYEPGSWGPEESENLIYPRRWALPDARKGKT